MRCLLLRSHGLLIRYLVCLCCELSLWWLTRYYIYSKVVINGVDSFRFSGIMFVSERHNRCASKMRVFKSNTRKDIDPRKWVKCISWDVEGEVENYWACNWL